MSYVNSKNSTATSAPTAKSALIIGAIGVVYGDIGTSPLYTLRACLEGYEHFSAAQVLGTLSWLFWMLMIVVSLKYVMFILRADNKGEGGTMALLELAIKGRSKYEKLILIALGTFGTALFYGDSMITPAISVLSAVEGISLISSDFDHWVIPICLVIIVSLFGIQSRGTAAVGRLFGPVMMGWFFVLAAMGLWQISQNPEVLLALNPVYALAIIGEAPLQTFLLLGAVVLALTGAEALYADMGHFGRDSIRKAWFALVLPSLTLCYFGQGALLLRNPEAIKNPFFLMIPEWGLLPLVILAGIATVIASQAVISGAFSVTRQAVQLGFWPHMEILHTSESEEGQIYLPRVNWLLLAAVIALVLIFRKSDNLASAYGLAVTGTMLITTILAFEVLLRHVQGLKKTLMVVCLSILLCVDLLFFASNSIKFAEGGWLPLLVGAIIFMLMMTWRNGRALLSDLQQRDRHPLGDFMAMLEAHPPSRVAGTAVFMAEAQGIVPPSLLHNLKHNKVLHEQNLFLHVRVGDSPYVAGGDKFVVQRLSETSWEASLTYGFKEEPDVPAALEFIATQQPELNLNPMSTSYFLSRETLVVMQHFSLRSIRNRLFSVMLRNSTRSTRFFKIPPNRVVEMGTQVEI
jgi:KUP system potassium uptake protein